ncbi:peptidoglycan editing factor PgeF [Aliidiomarina sanyensis]|uniref:Purine nucleoside phosphorylase n=1 Tax=Aliidiomarina sanyensis TaxID=1249555 RepID=A0A432WBF4_9GAMM|nr:peptidoglycan editing factor PgeF [Aliidiomarina sanyensis]RUO29088.1 peptidoglycan editing factor PgeF [Aliidiomarina sanyensis]
MKTLPAIWNVPSSVQAHTTLRSGGVSVSPYDSLNLGTHVGDLPASVQQNRARLRDQLKLPQEPNWLSQIHSNQIVRVGASGLQDIPEADGAYTNQPDVVLAILTADCLPVFLASSDGQELALLHCGWRGIALGIIERAVAMFACPPDQIQAWLGPCIGPDAFEVGHDVLDAMSHRNTRHQSAFIPRGGKFLANLYQIALNELEAQGVLAVTSCNECTFTQSTHYFSYRKAGGATGRMASVLWRSESSTRK